MGYRPFPANSSPIYRLMVASGEPMKLCECGCGRPAPIAKRTDNAIGVVKGKPRRFIKGHSGGRKANPQPYAVEERGYKTPCWIWQGAISGVGYGTIGWGKEARGAHRVFYERSRGPIPEGLTLDHLCRQRACVNPDHLEAVTHAENSRRGAKTQLTAEQVAAIRASTEGPTAIARRLGVSARHISHIRRGERW